MDASSGSVQPQQPSSANQPSTTGPQIRSRITVVCAECKRLKLKCDRRAPCGSCTKRGTVERCIYSPAAAEKVDLHSLNNRLIQVEATLAMVTSGQNPPAFQSTYPLAHSASQHQGSHQHHHHYAAPVTNTSISLSHQDLSLWLEELDLGISLSSSSSSAQLTGTSGYIKLEPIELTHPNSTKSISTSSPLKRITHLHTSSQSQRRFSARLSLPALSIYYPIPSAAPFRHHPSSSSTIQVPTSPPMPPPSPCTYTFTAHSQSPQHSKPQITPALIALLPSLPTVRRYLNYAKEVFRIRPVPFEPGNGWLAFENKCILLLGGGNLAKKEDRDRAKEREKAREAKRARQIYFSGIPELQSLHRRNDHLDEDDGGGGGGSDFGRGQTVDGSGDEEIPLTFFAIMCAVFAVGSHSSQSSNSAENPAFFFALSQQALGVWDTHTSSSGNANDRERMDFLLANLIGIVYLMLSGSSAPPSEKDEDREGINLVYPLVGKMVNAARGMGLDRDGSGRKAKTAHSDKKVFDDSTYRARSGDQTNKEKEVGRSRLWEDWKLLVWWDIMFYDLFLADSLGHQPYVSSYAHVTKLPRCAIDPAHPAMPADPDNDGFDTEDEEPEYSHGHDSGQGMAMQQDDFDGRDRCQHTMNGSGDAEPDEEAYFGARCRLTQLTQTIKHRMAHPECCCGYTLDQAASLENEIRRWQLNLTPNIKRLGVSSGENVVHTPPPYGSDLGEDKPAASSVSTTLSCELTLMANLLMFRVYAPFLRSPSPGPTTTSQPSSTTFQPNGHAAQSTVHAAQSILRTARLLHVALGPSMPLPSMMDFYPLEKMVLDSIIICANPGLSTRSSATWMFDGNALMNDVISGLRLLSELRVMTEPHRQIVDALYKKLSHRETNLLKRKYDQVDMTSDSLTASSTMTANASNNGVVGIVPEFDGSQYVPDGSLVTQQQQQSKPVDPLLTFSPQVSSLSIPSGGHQQQHDQKHKMSDNGDLISAITMAASARLAAAAAEREREKGKDKSGKHPKKSHPSVGIRVRVGKDGSIIRPQRVQSTVGSGGQMQAPPLMTTTPRPNADAVLAFQQQQKQKLQAATATPVAHAPTGSQNSQTSSQTSSPGNINMMHEQHRSRSSSFSHVQPQQQLQPPDVNSRSMDLPLPFVSSPEQMDIQVIPRKDYDLQDTHSQRRHQPFGSGHMFEQTQTQSRSSFDINGSSGASADGMMYNQISSPFSNGSGAISASSSPFTTSSGHPPTPTFPSHHSTPPVFGEYGPTPTSAASPAAYFHGSSPFNTSYTTNSPTSSSLTTLQPHGNGPSMPLMDMGMDPIIMPPALETSIYDKSQQQQSAMDNMSRHHHHHHQQRQQSQQQHFQHSSYDDGSRNHGHMVAVAPPWPPPQQQQQQQQSSMSAQNSPPFWNTGEGFKFYS